jgi:serine phosphatase RsbU (regulator of sigma subunit)/ABC-type amino acid transport substrate-binding protein
MKRLAISLLGWLLAGLWAQAEPTLTEAQRDWLHRHGKLVFVADADYPPYTYLKDNQPQGLDADLARAVGRTLGVEVEIRPAHWNEAMQWVQEGRADILAGIVQSEDRRDAWAFATPHADVQYFLFVRDALQTIHELKDLEGMRVGVGKGSPAEPILRANPKITTLNYDRGHGMEELSNREISAFAGNLVVQRNFIETRGIPGIKVVGDALIPPLPYGMAVPHGHEELLGLLNAALRELETKGELSALKHKWFGDLLRPALISRRGLRWLWVGLGCLAGLAGLGLLRSWELRRMVQRKTARISALRALGHSFGEMRDVDGVLARAMDVLAPLVNPESLFVVVDAGGQRLARHTRLPAKLSQELDPASCFEGDGLVAQVKRDGQPVVLSRLPAETRLVKTPVREFDYRSLACLPIVAEGQTLGVFGVLSPQAARFESKDMDFQQAVAAELGIAVANASLFATLEQRVKTRTMELNARNQQLEADLSMAREVQVALQPLLNSSAVEIARHEGAEPMALTLWNRSSTARTVGGDFFSIMRSAPGTCSVFICDVMGQGARAALLTAIVRTVLDELTEEPRDAQRFMTDLNRRLTSVLKTQSSPIFATAFYACFDLAARQIIYANAGHPWPLVINRRSGRSELIGHNQKHGPALGIFEDAEFPKISQPMTAGEVWLLYTDGLFETANPAGESFGMERVQHIVGQQLAQPLSDVLDGLMRDLIHFTGQEEIDDDICLLAIEAGNGPVAGHSR